MSQQEEHHVVLRHRHSFTNTTDGGEYLTTKLSHHIASCSEVDIGMEATGHYWLALYSFLVSKGYGVHVINPIQTDGWRKGIEIRMIRF